MLPHPLNPNEPKWQYRDLKRMHELATTAVFGDFGLGGFGQPIILFVLEVDSNRNEFPTQRELAQRLNLSPATITVSLKSLERRGCIRKVPDKADMRKNRIHITEKGKKVAESCREAFDKVDEAMYLGFSPDEMALISSFYIRMTDNLKTLIRDNPHEPKEEPSC